MTLRRLRLRAPCEWVRGLIVRFGALPFVALWPEADQVEHHWKCLLFRAKLSCRRGGADGRI
jgi:hypothetical protein